MPPVSFNLFVSVVSKCFIFISPSDHTISSEAEKGEGAEEGDITGGQSRHCDDGACAHARYGGVILSSAFNLSMQVLRYLTFTLRASLLPLSASDGVQRLQSSCVCRKKALLLFASVFVCFTCTSLCLRVCVLQPQSRSGLVQETGFDTSAVKITCVQTVIALQTIRTAITHF